MRYQIVDVFSDVPLSGNALCVVLDACAPSQMQALAREVNLSETTFPTITAAGSYTNRIFTPTTELSFAGHPTLGTAFVLGPGRWQQTTSGATVTVEVDDEGARMSQPDPEIEQVDVPTLERALDVTQMIGAYEAQIGGVRFLIAPVDGAIGDATPNQLELARLSVERSLTGVAMIERLDDQRVHVRVFVPSAGIAEDPGTGGVAGAIGVLAGDLWGTAADLTLFQGAEVGRPCRIEVHGRRGAVRVGGRVARCATGTFTL
jgi:trans-2,3-dihydro-3-hydroxyanthranilate isomerase